MEQIQLRKKISWDKYSEYKEKLESLELLNPNERIITNKKLSTKLKEACTYFFQSTLFECLEFLVSMFLRLTCLLILIYIMLMVIHETDSYLPLVFIVFILGIFADLIYLICRKKEHTGFNFFVLFYSLGMMPALWLQHEINISFINYTGGIDTSNMNIKYPSEKQFEETKNTELFLFGSLVLIRVILPRKDDWNCRSNLDLLMHDVIYVTDSLDFASILFDDSKKSVDKTFETLVLWCLAYTTCFFSLNPIYRPSRIHISKYDELNLFERIELRLAYDPFVRFVIPSLFYELPMIVFRTYILYSYELVEWNNLTFLLKNIVSIFLNVAIYFEIRKLKVDCVFYTCDII